MTERANGGARGRSSGIRRGPAGVVPGVSDPRPTLSVLDLVPVRSDQATGDAIAASRRLAQTADELGYERYWVAEHHNMPAVAATNPPVLIAMLAAATERAEGVARSGWRRGPICSSTPSVDISVRMSST